MNRYNRRRQRRVSIEYITAASFWHPKLKYKKLFSFLHAGDEMSGLAQLWELTVQVRSLNTNDGIGRSVLCVGKQHRSGATLWNRYSQILAGEGDVQSTQQSHTHAQFRQCVRQAQDVCSLATPVFFFAHTNGEPNLANLREKSIWGLFLVLLLLLSMHFQHRFCLRLTTVDIFSSVCAE